MYEVKHADPQAEQRWFEEAKGDAQWKGKMGAFFAVSGGAGIQVLHGGRF